MNNETKMLLERIDSYTKLQGIELTEDQRQGVLNGVKFWYNYVVDDAVSDAINGVIFEEFV